MLKLSASIIGVVIALMVSLNGVLAGIIGNTLTLPIINVSGLVTISIVLLFIKDKTKNGKVPFYLNTAGIIGVLMILLNNRCFEALGVSLTLSLGILGQTIGSIFADSTGFLGMKLYKFDKKKISGLLLLLLGIFTMTESFRGDILNMIFAFSAGVLVVLAMIINSQLSLRIGTFKGVQRNFLIGLFVSLIVLFFSDSSKAINFNLLVSIHPVFLLGGGILGVFVVAVSNKILPAIPVVYTTLLIFSGQVGAGILIDYLVRNEFAIKKLIGAVIILLGLFINLMIDKSAEKSPSLNEELSYPALKRSH